MIVVNQNRNGFVNIDNVNEILANNATVVAKCGNEVSILGEYASELRAEQAIRSIIDNLRKGIVVFEMPKSFN